MLTQPPSDVTAPSRWRMLPVAVCLLLLTGGCESLGFVNSDDDGPPRRERVTHDSLGTGTIPADVLDEGSHGAIQEETKKVLRSEEAYASFWQTLHANRRSAPERPSVDFDRAVVVAIAIGQRPSGGYGVHIDTVRALPNSAPVQVTFTEGKPGEDCLVSTVITSPYVLATVETDRDFVFEKSTVTGSCK